MIRSTLAALLVGVCGDFANLQVWILVVASWFSFFGLAHREKGESRTGQDWSAWLMQAAFLAVLCGAAWDNRNPAQPFEFGLLGITGNLLIIAGLELRRRTIATMGEQFSIKVIVDPDHNLIESGPFRILRHPSYSSLGLLALGVAAAVRSPLALLATVVVWLPIIVVRIHREEAALGRELGSRYQEYSRRTWRLLPGIY